MPDFILDTFTGPDGNLSAHTGEQGASWAYRSGAGILIGGNAVYGTGGPTMICASGLPSGADCSVTAAFRYRSNLGTSCGVACRVSLVAPLNCYLLIYNNSSKAWVLYKQLSGGFFVIGSFAQTLTVGGGYTMELRCVGNTISAFIDGVQRIQVTDNSVILAGSVGIWMVESAGPTTGMALESISANDTPAQSPPPATLTMGPASLVSATNQALTVQGSATGGTPPISYQWYRSSIANFMPGVSNEIPGGTTATYVSAPPPGPSYHILRATDAAGTVRTSNQICGQLTLPPLAIGFIGDSITQSPSLAAAERPPQQAGTLLGRSRLVTVVNQGVSSQTAYNWRPEGLLPQAKAAFAAGGVTWVHICLGTNDAAQGYGAAVYQDYMQQIVNDLVLSGYKVVVSAPPYTPAGASGGATNQAATELCRQYQGVPAMLADGINVFLGDDTSYGYFANHLSEYQADQTHPNATGAATLGILWAYAMAKAIYGGAG